MIIIFLSSFSFDAAVIKASILILPQDKSIMA